MAGFTPNSEVTHTGKKSTSLTDHVIGDVDLDLSFCLERHLAFNTLVGLLL